MTTRRTSMTAATIPIIPPNDIDAASNWSGPFTALGAGDPTINNSFGTNETASRDEYQ